MSKRSRSRPGRDVSAITSLRLPLLRPIRLSTVTPVPSLIEAEDRRTYHPDRAFRAPRRIDGSRASFKLITRANSPFGSEGFVEPQSVNICVRRQRRKEVMFATRRAGKVGQRRPRRTPFSSISCRRK